MKNKMYDYLIIAFVLLAVGVGIYLKLPNANRETINSQGSAVMKVDPDEVAITIRIDTLEESADESNTKNSEISDNVLFALYKLGISKDDISTEQFRVYEEFEWIASRRKSLGYKTSNILKVKTDDFMLTGKIVDAAMNNGASGIDYINFEISDQNQKELKKQALEDAAKNAREKAEALVKGVGGRLGRIVSVSEQGYFYRPTPLYEKTMGAPALEEAISTEIIPQELEIRADVNVVFEIK